jgi:aquaporin Z
VAISTSLIRDHLAEYLIEAWGLGTFMVSACVFGVILFHSDSSFAGHSFALRTIWMGIAMGGTAIAIFTSPWGKRSGAHINPVVTLTFYRLGKINTTDAIFYSVAQFSGGVLGVLLSWLVLGERLADQSVNFVPTIPGIYGNAAAFAGEFIIAFGMMAVVLFTSNHQRLFRFTPFFAGALVAIYISIESPISGMSINPARTVGSAVFSNTWTALWIYFTAPLLAMLAAAEIYLRYVGLQKVHCAKLDHRDGARCIFNCEFDQLTAEDQTSANPVVAIEVTDRPHMFRSVGGLF